MPQSIYLLQVPPMYQQVAECWDAFDVLYWSEGNPVINLLGQHIVILPGRGWAWELAKEPAILSQ